jgi:DNA-binding transcriptional LysR family regulator
MRDLDLTSLRLFVAVCDTGNIARAAELNNLVASAVSKRLSALEQSLGPKLFTRVKHGVSPTAAGQTLLEHAREMLARTHRIERDMGLFATGSMAQIRLLASTSALAEHLADDTALFLSAPEHANIRIDIEERLSPEIVRGIREGAAVIGICWDATSTTGLHTLPYRKDHLCVAVPMGHPLTRQTSLTLWDTLAFEHVSLPINSAVQVMLQRSAALLGRNISHRVVVSNFESALRVVRAKLAITVVPREVGAVYAQRYGLALIPLDEAWAVRQMNLVYRSVESLSPAAHALLNFLHGQAQLSTSAPATARGDVKTPSPPAPGVAYTN